MLPYENAGRIALISERDVENIIVAKPGEEWASVADPSMRLSIIEASCLGVYFFYNLDIFRVEHRCHTKDFYARHKFVTSDGILIVPKSTQCWQCISDTNFKCIIISCECVASAGYSIVVSFYYTMDPGKVTQGVGIRSFLARWELSSNDDV